MLRGGLQRKNSPRKRRSQTRRPTLQAVRRPPPSVMATPSKNSGCSNIRVILRVRPSTIRELEDARNREVVEVVDKSLVIFDPKEEEDPFFLHGRKQTYRDINKRERKDMQFSFDSVFGPEDCTSQVYAQSVQSLISSLLAGYNCTVFAYGATGSGKTHTMLGSEATPGVTPLLMSELYSTLSSIEGATVDVAISYLEIYNESVHDLLVDQGKVKPLQLREDGASVLVSDLSWHRPATAQDLMAVLQLGNQRRTQHPTDANAESSRSHAVFQVVVKIKRTDARPGQVRCAKLSMIDLAGSERAAATKNSRSRFTEGANINKSLLALGNCINALADSCKHVPFRNSKLTRLLKGSLGGNCQTVMVANVSPSSLVYEDTYNTLKYATRAKKIKNKVKKNQVSMEVNAAEFARAIELAHAEIATLKEQNAKLTSENCALLKEKTEWMSGEQLQIVQAQAESVTKSETYPEWLTKLSGEQLQILQAHAESITKGEPDAPVLIHEAVVVPVLEQVPAVPDNQNLTMELEAKVRGLESELESMKSCLDSEKLLGVLRDIGDSLKRFRSVSEVKHSLCLQLSNLEYNFEKKKRRIERLKQLKKDATQTKVQSLALKTQTQRSSLESRIRDAEERESREKGALEQSASEFLKEVAKVGGGGEQVALALKPCLAALVEVQDLSAQVDYCRRTESSRTREIHLLQSQFLRCSGILHSAYYALRGLSALSPDTERQFDELLAAIRQPGNVTFSAADETFCEEPDESTFVREEEENEVLAEPLNATFCLPPKPRLSTVTVTRPGPIPKIAIAPVKLAVPLSSRVDQNRMMGPPPASFKKPRPSPPPPAKKLKPSPPPSLVTTKKPSLPCPPPSTPRQVAAAYRTITPASARTYRITRKSLPGKLAKFQIYRSPEAHSHANPLQKV